MTPRNALPPVHPEEFLKKILGELGTSQAEFACIVGLSAMKISHVIKGKRPITAETALFFGKTFELKRLLRQPH
jgi:plasmid maintenance system antidote protein VapI